MWFVEHSRRSTGSVLGRRRSHSSENLVGILAVKKCPHGYDTPSCQECTTSEAPSAMLNVSRKGTESSLTLGGAKSHDNNDIVFVHGFEPGNQDRMSFRPPDRAGTSPGVWKPAVGQRPGVGSQYQI